MQPDLGPALLHPGRTHLIGATWPYDSKPDAVVLSGHSKVTILEQRGCGVVTHLHASNYLVQGGRFGTDWDNPLVSGLVLSVWYDESEQPAIRMPLMDFFADITCRSDFFSSLWFSKVRFSHNMRLPMPFGRYIRMEVENTTDANMTGYMEIQWDALPELPEHCGYLHTDFREGRALIPDEKITVCDIRSPGAVVAHWLELSTEDPLCANGERLCEGNHCFFMGGETAPGMESQGTEDYYNYSWGFRDEGRDYWCPVLKHEALPSGGARIALLRCRDHDTIKIDHSCVGMIDYTQEYFSALSKNPKHAGNTPHHFTADYKSCYYYYCR